MSKLAFRDGIARDGKRWRLRVVVAGRVCKGVFREQHEAVAARDALKRRGTAIRLGLAVERPKPRTHTIGSVLDHYEAECAALEKSDSMLDSIEYARRLFDKWRGLKLPVNELTRDDLVAFYAWGREHTESKTGRALQLAIQILSTAARGCDLAFPRLPVIERNPPPNKTVPQGSLLRFLAAMPPGSVLSLAASIGLWTGARYSELIRIDLRHVDIEGNRIALLRHKGKAGRRKRIEIVPIPNWLTDEIKAYVAARPNLEADDPLLAVERYGPRRRLKRHSLVNALRDACAKAGIKPAKTSLAWLRSQHATLARQGGLKLGWVKTSLGHAHESITETFYDKSDQRNVEQVRASILAQQAIAQALGYTRGTDPGTDITESETRTPSK